jgi:hypothetical protein
LLAEQRESIEAARKAAKRRLPLPGQAVPAERSGSGNGSGDFGTAATLHPDDWLVQVTAVRAVHFGQPWRAVYVV